MSNECKRRKRKIRKRKKKKRIWKRWWAIDRPNRSEAQIKEENEEGKECEWCEIGIEKAVHNVTMMSGELKARSDAWSAGGKKASVHNGNPTTEKWMRSARWRRQTMGTGMRLATNERRSKHDSSVCIRVVTTVERTGHVVVACFTLRKVDSKNCHGIARTR